MMRAAFYKSVRPGLQGIYSRGVRFMDRGEFSHCELIFSDGLSASASYIDKGVRMKRIVYDPAHWDIIDLPDFDEAAARTWFCSRVGHGYDLPGNLRFVFGLVHEDDGKWFCSEALMAALGFAEPWRFGPNGAAAALRRWCQSRPTQPASAGFFTPTESKGAHETQQTPADGPPAPLPTRPAVLPLPAEPAPELAAPTPATLPWWRRPVQSIFEKRS